MKIGDKTLVKTLAQPFRADIRASAEIQHARQFGAEDGEIGVERVALGAADGGAKTQEDAMADQNGFSSLPRRDVTGGIC
jgi:hypothetical protein